MKMNNPARVIALLLLCLAATSCVTNNATLTDTAETLIDAARKGDTATVKALLDTGTNVNAQAKNGETALMHAASRGHTDTVRLLLDAGADVNAQTKETMINALKSTKDQRICDKFSSDYRLLLKTRLMWRHF